MRHILVTYLAVFFFLLRLVIIAVLSCQMLKADTDPSFDCTRRSWLVIKTCNFELLRAKRCILIRTGICLALNIIQFTLNNKHCGGLTPQAIIRLTLTDLESLNNIETDLFNVKRLKKISSCYLELTLIIEKLK